MLDRRCLYCLRVKALPQNICREALVLIASGRVCAQALDAADHEPAALVADKSRLLEQLFHMTASTGCA